jgi:hypothetical protein
MYSDIVYLLSLTILPQAWIDAESAHGATFLSADPDPYDPVVDEVVRMDPQENATMGDPEVEPEDDDDRALAEEVRADMESETESEGLALTGSPLPATPCPWTWRAMPPREHSPLTPQGRWPTKWPTSC